MEVEQMSYYNHAAAQNKYIKLKGSWEEDKLLIRLQFYKCDEYYDRSGRIFHEIGPLLSQRSFWVKFSHFKQQLSDDNESNREYGNLICKHLKSMGVPEDEHAAILHKIFDVVRAAVSPVDPVLLLVWDITCHNRPNSIIPASRSFIQGLELMTLLDAHTTSPSCAICLGDFEQEEPITGLPCTHHFHIHCIVPWLNINHLCPLCRYPMPTQEDHSVSSFVCGILRSVFFITNNLREAIREHRYLIMFLWCLMIAICLLSFL